jgi:hypothetical protein
MDVGSQFMGKGKAFAGTINLALTGAVPGALARSESIGKVPALVAARPAECGDVLVSKLMELPLLVARITDAAMPVRIPVDIKHPRPSCHEQQFVRPCA